MEFLDGKPRDLTVIGFDAISACDRQTYRLELKAKSRMRDIDFHSYKSYAVVSRPLTQAGAFLYLKCPNHKLLNIPLPRTAFV